MFFVFVSDLYSVLIYRVNSHRSYFHIKYTSLRKIHIIILNIHHLDASILCIDNVETIFIHT